MTPANYQSDELLLDLDTPSYHAYSIKEAGVDIQAIYDEAKEINAQIQLKPTPDGTLDGDIEVPSNEISKK